MPLALRLLRLACATLILVAVVVQFLTPDDPWAQAANFFSFFTIQSHLLAAGVLLAFALRGDRPRGRALELARGTVTLYL